MTEGLRIPFGLDRLPRNFVPGDMRVPSAVAGADKLRLNSEPVPADAMPLATGDHTARITAARDWMISLCGDYAPLRRQFISSYLEFVTAHLVAHRSELAEHLRRYHGLYAPEDWTWSALRPLPRAWLPAGERMLQAEIVFWDGARPIAVELAARPTERQAALLAAGIDVVRVDPPVLSGDPMQLAALLPACFQYFWQSQTLPSSPFRRPIPQGLVTA
jgi:hypothetical protein